MARIGDLILNYNLILSNIIISNLIGFITNIKLISLRNSLQMISHWDDLFICKVPSSFYFKEIREMISNWILFLKLLPLRSRPSASSKIGIISRF